MQAMVSRLWMPEHSADAVELQSRLSHISHFVVCFASVVHVQPDVIMPAGSAGLPPIFGGSTTLQMLTQHTAHCRSCTPAMKPFVSGYIYAHACGAASGTCLFEQDKGGNTTHRISSAWWEMTRQHGPYNIWYKPVRNTIARDVVYRHAHTQARMC